MNPLALSAVADGSSATEGGSRLPGDQREQQDEVSSACTSVLECVLAGLDRLPTGLALVDQTSKVLYLNVAARKALESAGWSTAGNRLNCLHSADKLTWLRSLHQVCERGQRQLVGLRMASGKSFAALAPVLVDDACHALVTFGRSELCGVLELQLFASQHGLTLTEGQVLRKLALGMRPSQIAIDHGVSVTTVVTQVAAVRAKTGSSSVRQLLAMLSQLPPVQPAFSPG